MSKTITIAEGKAATIVSPSQLAINLGAQVGVETGDTITVRRSVRVTDPDDHKQLGYVHLNRLRLRVTMVADSFSVGTVTDQIPNNLASALDITRISRYKTIVTSESEASNSAVFVEPGESVVVTRTVELEEEPEH